MQRQILGLTLRDKISNSKLRVITKTHDLVYNSKSQKIEMEMPFDESPENQVDTDIYHVGSTHRKRNKTEPEENR